MNPPYLRSMKLSSLRRERVCKSCSFFEFGASTVKSTGLKAKDIVFVVSQEHFNGGVG